MKSLALAASFLGLSLLAMGGVAHADPVDDCVTLLNDCNSQISNLADWPTWLEISALGENQPAIDRVDRELKAAADAYAAATTCAQSPEARGSSRYAQYLPRFNKEFPAYYEALGRAREAYDVLGKAISLNNELRDLSRALDAAKPDEYEAWTAKQTQALAKAAEAAKANTFLSEKWHRDWDAALSARLQNLRARRLEADREATTQAILANTVVQKLPDLTREDASDPRKVAAAFEKMPQDTYVTAAKGKSNVTIDYAPAAATHPMETRLGLSYPGDEKPDTPAFVFYDQRTIFVRYVRDGYRSLEGPVSGLVWDALEDGRLILVSADGGRYLARVEHITPGLGEEDDGTSDPAHAVLSEEDVQALGELKVLNPSYAKRMTKAKEAYKKCAAGVWKANEPKFKRIEKANILPDARRAQRADLDGHVRKSIDGKCRSHQAAYTSAWSAAMSDYLKMRAATHEVARARLTAARQSQRAD